MLKHKLSAGGRIFAVDDESSINIDNLGPKTKEEIKNSGRYLKKERKILGARGSSRRYRYFGEDSAEGGTVMKKIKVLIADDHSLFREGLRKLLESETNLEIISEVGDGQGAINVARRLKPDLVLMDINMPGTNGLVATQVIKREMPDIKVIALTVCEGEEVLAAVKAGVSAYMLKDVLGSDLLQAIKQVLEGEVVIHPRVAGQLVQELTRPDKGQEKINLTRREIDILEMLVKGNSNREMAEAMFISEKTVKNHLTSIFRKLGVKDRTQAAVFALKNKIVADA